MIRVQSPDPYAAILRLAFPVPPTTGEFAVLLGLPDRPASYRHARLLIARARPGSYIRKRVG